MVGRSIRTTLAASLLLLPLVTARPATAPLARAAGSSMTCTVTQVDLAARQLHVILGTGHALRTMTCHAPTDCRIKVAGNAASLEDITRGQIVEIHGRETAAGYEAESIETLPPPAVPRPQ